MPSVDESDLSWEWRTPEATAELLRAVPVRWWLSGGSALDHWLGQTTRTHTHSNVSVVRGDLEGFVANLPPGFSAWTSVSEEEGLIAFADAPTDADLHPVVIRDDATQTFVLMVNVEDGADQAWIYKRDPRLQLPWSKAVLDVGGIPTGAPEVQLLWKALRPRPEDDLDKDAVWPRLSDEVRGWWERAILSIHPHSTWSIHVRSPFAPAKASWNRKKS